MKADVRRKLDMADRVLIFSGAHPSPDAGSKAVFDLLAERVARAKALAALQRSGQIAARAATTRRKGLRAELQQGLLRFLVRVGEAAGQEVAELAGRFQLPRLNATNFGFVTTAGTMLAHAQAHREVFLKLGMTDERIA